MVGPKGEFIDTNAGRVINPGHCIECSWFLMERARITDDDALKQQAIQIFDMAYEKAFFQKTRQKNVLAWLT